MRSILVPVLFVITLLAAVPAAGETAVAVMEFASKGGVTQKQMDALGDMLANEIREMGDYRVIGKSDIRAALNFEEQKSLLGCTDEACIAELGGALGVRWVVVGNVSKFGQTFLLNLKILDVEMIRVAKGVSKKVTGGEDKLIDALAQAAGELIEGARASMHPDAAAGETSTTPSASAPGADHSTETTQPDTRHATPDTDPSLAPADAAAGVTPMPPGVTTGAPGRPLDTWGHAAFWSGAGLLVLGGGAMIVSMHEGSVYQNDDETHEARLDAAGKSRAWAGVMWAGYGAGAALLATGITLWLLDDDAPGTTTAGAAPTPDGSGWVFGLGGRW